MSRLSKETQLRNEGMCHIMNLLEAGHSVDEIREEVKRRGAYHIPIVLTKAEEQEYCGKVKRQCIKTILLMSMMVLRDEFDFGNESRNGKLGRMDRFRKRFNDMSAALGDDYLTWEDMEETLIKELGIERVFMKE